jgi:hypothetical protein
LLGDLPEGPADVGGVQSGAGERREHQVMIFPGPPGLGS